MGKFKCLSVAIIALVTCGCGATKSKDKYLKYIDDYYNNYNNNNYDYIARLGDKSFLKATSKDEYIDLLKKRKIIYGKHKNHSLISWVVSKEITGKGDSIFTAKYKVVYENGETEEKFVLVLSEGKIRIKSYTPECG